MKDFKLKIKAGTLDGLVEDAEITTKIFILSEDSEHTNYLFIGNYGKFPACPLGTPAAESFGGNSDVHHYVNNPIERAKVEYFSHVKWTKKEWDYRFEGKYKEKIIAHVKSGKILKGDEKSLEDAGILLSI